MKIIVTGGAGCIGSTLAEELDLQGHNVTIIDNLMRGAESKKILAEVLSKHPKILFHKIDILNFNKIKNLIKDTDVIFHLAALPSHRLALEKPRQYALVDLIGTINILESARLSAKKPKIIFASTNKVYGKNIPPFNENVTPKPLGPYGQGKLDAEEWCKLYSDFYGITTVIARLFHVLGHRTQPDREISIFTESIINNSPIFVHGKTINNKFTSCSAGYTNVHDTVAGLILLMEKVNQFDIFNIGRQNETSVKQLALYIYKYLNKKPNIIEKQMLPHESLRHSADNAKIKQLGWKQKFTPHDSVKQYVDWRKAHGKRKAIYR